MDAFLRERKQITRDVQKQAVYAWEDTRLNVLEKPRADLKSFRKYARHVFRTIGIEPPGIKFTRRNGAVAHNDVKMIFGPNARNKEILMHESAHIIAFNKLAKNHVLYQSHGPEWLATYIHLLARFCDYDRNELIASARRLGGLKVAPFSLLEKERQLTRSEMLNSFK